MSKRKSKPDDHRLHRVLTILDEISDYAATSNEPNPPDWEALAIEMFTAAVRNVAELPRINEALALLWKDNDDHTYCDEEARRAAMTEIADRAHRLVCDCCRGAHERSVLYVAETQKAAVQ